MALWIVLVLAVPFVPDYENVADHWQAAVLTAGLGVAGYLPVLAFTHGIRRSRLGIMAPIAATAPLITVLLAFTFLHVPITSVQWLAVGLVVLANVLVCLDFGNWRDSNLLRGSSGVPFALVAALGWGIFYFLLVPASRSLGPWVSAFLVELGVTVAAGLHVLRVGQPTRPAGVLDPGSSSTRSSSPSALWPSPWGSATTTSASWRRSATPLP